MLDQLIVRPGAADLNRLVQDQAHQDIAERFQFGAPPVAQLANFDQRSDADLLRAATESPTGLERERALWEYAHRNRGLALDALTRHLRSEPDASVRWNLLWLLVKHGEQAVVPVLKDALTDDSPEVRDWAGLFLQEMTGEVRQSVYDVLEWENDRTFDQTLPLQIAGFADVNLAGSWVQARLSPQWFASILGRVLACTNTDTYMTDLIIEKELVGYHEDGSNHYETFMFRGASYTMSDTVTQHVYESNTLRPFYKSGKVKEGPAVMTPVSLSRAAGTERLRPQHMLGVEWRSSDGTDSARGERLREVGVFRSVRGRFWGWAHIDVDRYLEIGDVAPGTVQLVSTADPVVGKLANTVIYGTFRGKLSDVTGDGTLKVNSIPCHATVDGELDLDLDGVADRDPRVVAVK